MLAWAGVMLGKYVWRDLVRNPRRNLAALLGITLGVGLFSAVLFFIDGSSASMTQRAVQPLPIDIQRILTAPLGGRLHLTQTLEPSGSLAPGARVTVHLMLRNDTTSAANEVVLRSEPPAGLTYVPGSASRAGAPLPQGQAGNPFAQGVAKTGLNVGSLAPGTTVAMAYDVIAGGPVDTRDGLRFQTSFSTREVITPVRANASDQVGPQELADRIARIDGVAAADSLSFADLPASSLSVGSRRPSGTLRLFGFDARYQQRYSAIDIVEGAQTPAGALISLEAAHSLGVHVGDRVALTVPGATRPLELSISGTADLSRAKALFYSRHGKQLEDFLYTPNSLVIDPSTFDADVVPALRTATATGGTDTTAPPIREIDVQIARNRLDADPATALAQTTGIAAAVTAVAPGQDYLIDNISNTLRVARADAGVAKRMFVFLGVPGALMAAILAAYAGAVLASAQRREQAMLRIRGANRRHLLQMLALRSTLLTVLGSFLGLGFGRLSAQTVLGGDALARASASSLVASGLIGAGGGFLATGTALYAAGRGSIRRQINEDRAQVFSRAPAWWRARLDLLAVPAVGGIAVLALLTHAFDGTHGSVYNGRGVTLNLWLLALPVGVWIAGSLLAGRLFAWILEALPAPSPRFPRVIPGLLVRSLRRRSWAAVEAMVVVGLVLAAATSITAFTASYDQAKAADARFALGSDIRVTPSPTAPQTQDGAIPAALAAVQGISGSTPVVYGIENAVLRSHNESAGNVAAVDPATFPATVPVDEASFVGMSATRAFAALAADPSGALMSSRMADYIHAEVGDPLLVVLGSATDNPVTVKLRIIGLYERLPGFPEGADAVVAIARQKQAIPSTTPSFFLAGTADPSGSTLRSAVDRLHGGPAAQMTVETRESVLAKDQSSLAALNIQGLLTIDSSYALAMATVAIGIFVFGLLLQRRREYVTMRAQGMHASEIRALVVAETSAAAVMGCLAGIGVGIGMAYFLVHVLQPLFVLTPHLVVPAGGLVVLVLLSVAATLVASVAASALIGRLKPTELLRNE
jgi:putative ABC transport system permease protein